ncbi:MAG: hypothetical protein QOE77_4048 [Blastocatellia bacterium]|jgi:hypothetical protein|nr:hypothetical protein [Blastocatellia bacterium]
MRIAGVMIGGLAALAGCAAIGGPVPFQLTADQVNGAGSLALARAQIEADEQGLSPLWDPQPPVYSAASCRWIEPGRRARCRYRVQRGIHRPGSVRPWVEEQSEMYLTDGRWGFGG